MALPLIQILSTNHFAKTLLLSISKIWYFNDEEPEFITKIFIIYYFKIKIYQ